MQDGIDLIDALAIHPETAQRLARKLWIVLRQRESTRPTDDVRRRASRDVYLHERHEHEAGGARACSLSPQFTDPSRLLQALLVAGGVRRAVAQGSRLRGFSVNDALTPLLNMGQQLFEPPDVTGWELGPGWFSTGGMLARMNFAAQLATNQKFKLRDAGAAVRADARHRCVDFVLDALTLPAPSADVYAALLGLRARRRRRGRDRRAAARPRRPGCLT